MADKHCVDAKLNKETNMWECWHKIPLTWAIRKTMKQKEWPLSLGVNRAGCVRDNCDYYVGAS